MNGEVNGTMQEPIEISPHNSPEDNINRIVTSEDGDNETVQYVDSSHTDNSIHLSGDSSSDQIVNSNQLSLVANDENGDSVEEIIEDSGGQETINNIELEIICSNSNESYPGSIASSQGKAESVEQQNIDDKSRDDGSEKDYSKILMPNDMNSDDEIDSEEDSSDDECSEAEPEPVPEDTVSINSDSDAEDGNGVSQASERRHETIDIIVIESEMASSQNGNSHDDASIEIHEIGSDNDDCDNGDCDNDDCDNDVCDNGDCDNDDCDNDAVANDAESNDAVANDAESNDAVTNDAVANNAVANDAVVMNALPTNALPTNALPINALTTNAVVINTVAINVVPNAAVVNEQNINTFVDVKQTLRRSSRAIKRKRYNDIMKNGDMESDIEEVEMEDPLKRKMKPIVINDTKALVEMAAKQMKVNQNNQKKEPTVVIIDTNSLTSTKDSSNQVKNFGSTNSSASAQALYQSIVARGTSVTPVSSKAVSTQSTPPAHQPTILPSLTDDMFVVEAPSFIVPYVYEKPSIKPFREFVDKLGKELEEQRTKEEKEMLEKVQELKEKYYKDKQERRDRGEPVEDTDEEVEQMESFKMDEVEELVEKKRKKAEKRERRRRGNEDDDDDSWDGETSTESEDEINSDEDDKTVVIKDIADSFEEIKDVTDLTGEKVCSGKRDNYFDCSLGKFFINIGISLVQEYVQNDLLKQQSRKLYREKKGGHSTKSTETSIVSLMKNLEFSKENNAPFAFPQIKCEFCSFKSESMLAMAHHMETPHMKNNVYKCNFCPFEIRSPHDILYHMEAEHNSRGRLERAPAYHQCANCPFEDNGKGKLARHMIPCAKKFKAEFNLSPPLEWEPPAKIPKIPKSRNHMMAPYQGAFNRSTIGNTLIRPALTVASMLPGVATGYRPRGRSPMAVPPRAMPVHGTPIIRGGVMVRHNSPILMSPNYPIANNGKPKSMHQPSISITPLPRQPQPPAQTQAAAQAKNTFVICEICDGYIKDLEQLRNHMQWIHKVKIHPKMIYNRPPLNCQKCQFRFFTDQGLERHLLGSHGLVTSSMQEAANKGKDAGRCPVCGRVYQWKLLNHVARDHNITLKPAHLSYKCTVCTATFGMYKQFENHVYSAHSVVAKRVMDKGKASSTVSKCTNDSLLKPLKINDEITITPQPVKSSTSTKDK